MNKSHKQLVTSYPVAIKYGQGRLHIPSPIPWHAKSEAMKCPDCNTVFIVTDGFPKIQFLDALAADHKNQKGHPDYIASAPEWTKVADCTCAFDVNEPKPPDVATFQQHVK